MLGKLLSPKWNHSVQTWINNLTGFCFNSCNSRTILSFMLMDLTLSLTQDKMKLYLSGIKQIVYGYNWNFKKTHLSINTTKTLARVFVVDTFNSRRCRSEVSSLYFDLCFISFITISSHFFLNNDSIDRVFLIIFLSLKIYLYQFYVYV